MAQNKWTGPINAETGCKLPGVSCEGDHVTQLSLEHSLAGGQLPGSLAALDHALVLDLGSNMLSGPLPAEIGSMKNLAQIEADGNHFTGAIPAEWEALRKNACGEECGPRHGASTGGARVFLGFNSVKQEDGSKLFGFGCPYTEFLQGETSTSVDGSTVATGWGLSKECGLANEDKTPDEEDKVGGSGPPGEEEEEEEEEGDGDEGSEQEDEGQDANSAGDQDQDGGFDDL
eukprot:TRINITY_DN803_c0_g3_i1.p1 TRINITY_DN803_c0_g3~~TRINITY_DN803_c0_g3_i1.p1  ORF type:complete len:231 (+),score=50.20 TRINITY_DN803_c0_g3_i1:89-781(+)